LLTAVDDQILLPDVYFIVRHNTSTGTVFTAQGCVPDAKLAAPLFAIPSGKQDNYLALARPAAVTLDESGLIESGAFSPSPSAFIRTDELFVFDNTTTNKNKTAAATYYYQGNAWRKFGDLVGTWDDEPVFAPGTGFVIRKAAGTSTNWINSPTY
jgi:uncharacterized protein (TIGR02597 family)